MRSSRMASEIKVYGSGLLSSHGEIEHCDRVARRCSDIPIQLEWVINQYFEIDHYQPLLFVCGLVRPPVQLVGELERWMQRGQAEQRRARRARGERARSAQLSRGLADQVAGLSAA